MTSVPPSSGALLAGFGVLVVAVTAVVAALLIGLLHPLLVRYAMARPNVRSAHSTPTPQGGGIAVLGAAVLTALLGASALGDEGLTALDIGPGSVFMLDDAAWWRLCLVLSAALLVAAVGFVDDIWPLPPWPRLALQLIAMGVAVAALPDGARVLPGLPLAAERLLLVVGGAWFVNLTNFMDGMDWLTVVETVPLTAALASFWFFGVLSAPAGLAAMALRGGMLGFFTFNRPVARLFLGDVGSLAVGLLMAFCLFDLASHGGLVAAVLLPLYYIADSGITLAWRLLRGEPVWQAHRHHFYQVAVARGLSVHDVLVRVLAVNLVLVAFAAASLYQDRWELALTDLALGTLIVARLLRALARGRPAVQGRP